MGQDTQIDMFFRYKVINEDRFQNYLDGVLPATQNEPYVLEYHLFRDADGTTFQHERYQDEASIAKHEETTADAQAAFGESVELLDLRVVGDVNDAFKAHVDGFGLQATYWDRFRSVER